MPSKRSLFRVALVIRVTQGVRRADQRVQGMSAFSNFWTPIKGSAPKALGPSPRRLLPGLIRSRKKLVWSDGDSSLV